MIYITGFFVSAACLLYFCYKKFREAPYKPGSVVRSATNGPDFDDTDLYVKSTGNKWVMPNNVELFYFTPKKQSTANPMVCIHGGPAIAPTEPWKITEALDNAYLYHARGCGLSTRIHSEWPTPGMWPGIQTVEQDLGLSAQVSDIERIRRRVGTENEQLDIVGHSFGGFIATLYAAEFPQHVRSLTLLVPAAVLVLPSKEGDLFTTVGNRLKENGNEEHKTEYEAFLKRYLDFGSLPKETDDTLAQRQHDFAKHYYRALGEEDSKPVNIKMIGGMACFASFFSMGMEHDYIPKLKELLAEAIFPVSIVHGEKDILPESTSRKYVDLFPKGQVEFHTIEGGDHDLFDYAEVGEIVKATIERTK